MYQCDAKEVGEGRKKKRCSVNDQNKDTNEALVRIQVICVGR